LGVTSVPPRFSAVDEHVQWTCESEERRSGARPSATRGRDGNPAQSQFCPSATLGPGRREQSERLIPPVTLSNGAEIGVICGKIGMTEIALSL